MFTSEELDNAVNEALLTIPPDKQNALISRAEYRNGQVGISVSYAMRIKDKFVLVADLSWNPQDSVGIGAKQIQYVW